MVMQVRDMQEFREDGSYTKAGFDPSLPLVDVEASFGFDLEVAEYTRSKLIPCLSFQDVLSKLEKVEDGEAMEPHLSRSKSRVWFELERIRTAFKLDVFLWLELAMIWRETEMLASGGEDVDEIVNTFNEILEIWTKNKVAY